MSDAKRAEQLWLTAHEHVKQGNLAQAVRDLASCYEMLKALKDPRLAQVHRRWVEVHKLYQERKARAKAASQSQAIPVQAPASQSQAVPVQARAPASQSQAVPVQTPGQAPGQAPASSSPFGQMARTQVPPVEPAPTRPASASTPDLPVVASNEPVRVEPRFSQTEARTLQEEAEAAANAGHLEQAIALYTRLIEQAPGNELARERLAELKAAAARKDEMSGPHARPAHVAQTLPTPSVVASAPGAAERVAPGVSPRSFPPGSDGDVAFLQALLQQVQERARAR